MTHAQDDAVSDVSLDVLERTFVDHAAAVMSSIAAHRAHHDLARSTIPLPCPPPPKPGYDESKVDFDRPPVKGAITTHGTVLEYQPIDGKLSIEAEDVVIRGCPAVGRYLPSSGGAPVIDASSVKAKRFLIEDTQITVPTRHARWIEGVRLGPDATAIRVTVQDTVDGFGWLNKAGGTVQPVMIECEVFDLAWFPVDPLNTSHTDGTHNDPIQAHSPVGPARVIDGLYDAGTKGTAAMMLNVKSVAGLYVCGARLLGGRSGINLGPTPVANAVTLAHNIFGAATEVYATDAAKAGILMRGNLHIDGSPANTVTRS